MKLNDLRIGQKGFIESLDFSKSFAQRLIEMGFSLGTEVQVVLVGINKKLKAYKVKNTVVALRDETAQIINVNLNSGGNYE